ncbi:GNAT family N-acetyltransferase [Cohnella sp. JJ-181]|uniref:GNAT family N-acetyltransferase n=1 Tax=Cohnella rhizoplanae TaxID=2974897 RepID=UPI0023302DE4|nr:GNAT family N-acetyltransferase [Cohnella sp. JJ-181]
MNIRLVTLTEELFWDVVNLKSDPEQEKNIQIFERWVGSNAFFIGACHVYGFTPKAIYDNETLIGFTCYGYRREHGRYELVSMMLGHQFHGRGYGVPMLKAIINEMVEVFSCKEIYLSVIHDNARAIGICEKVGFRPTGDIEKGFHDEPIYCLKLN